MLSNNNQKYRADIDGLRAVAVLSVILFHINESLIPGGFIGVDIFFVISGYLISLHIFRDLEADRFSLLEFYRRRVKRIAPAMLVVIAVTVVVAQLILRPEDAERTAESGLWSLLSLANVYFWLFLDTSYFAPASNQLPLLHLWSLGVEEQFYLFWPLILLFTYKHGQGKKFFAAFAAIALASYFLGEYFFSADPSFVYYMLPTRAGELLAGALLAHVVIKRGSLVLPTAAVTTAAWMGWGLIIASLFLLDPEQTFPGFNAIPPSLGAVLIIMAGHYGNSFATRALTFRPLVWVGLVSYSAYLWHWPLLAFYRYGYGEVTLTAGIVLLALTLVLAWLSYRYIETPARHSSRPALQVMVRQYVIPCAMLGALSIGFMKIDGYGLRWLSDDYKARLASLEDSTKPSHGYDYVCQEMTLKAEDVSNPDCVLGTATSLPAKALLWGDSNAAHYIGVLGAFSDAAGFRFRNLEVSSCAPVDSDPTPYVAAKRAADCKQSQLLTLPATEAFPVVIISASWSTYQGISSGFFDAFLSTARKLADQDKLVILIGKAPIFPSYDRFCRAKSLSFPFMNCQASNGPLAEKVAQANARLKAFADSTPNVEYYDLNNRLCPGGSCSAYDSSGQPIYYDRGHLAMTASWEIGRQIVADHGVPFPFTAIADWPAPPTQAQSLTNNTESNH